MQVETLLIEVLEIFIESNHNLLYLVTQHSYTSLHFREDLTQAKIFQHTNVTSHRDAPQIKKMTKFIRLY